MKRLLVNVVLFVNGSHENDDEDLIACLFVVWCIRYKDIVMVCSIQNILYSFWGEGERHAHDSFKTNSGHLG